MLDTGPLGMVTNPKWNRAAGEWFRSMLEAGLEVIVPEIADYELRRNLILEGRDDSIRRLDQLKQHLKYLPLDTPTMVDAANLWADARRRHKPTAHKHALDGDAILAAQAKRVSATVATDNVGHLNEFVETRRWRDIGFGPDSPP
jgi:predicted nucleic acid-binding protein